MVWVSPLLKQGQLEPVAQDHVRLGFEYLQGQRLYHHTEQPIPMFDKPHNKEGFLLLNGIAHV